MHERDERESPSGAMRGGGDGAGSADLPYPRTDAEDTGLGDGGLERTRREAARTESSEADSPASRPAPRGDRLDPAPDAARAADSERDEGSRGADREHGGWGDRGIGGGRAGGTGL